MKLNRTMTQKEMDKLIKDDKVIFPLQRQPPPQPQEPFEINKFLQQLGQSLQNNKNQNARVKGQADQLMADSLSASYDSFTQLIQPLIQDNAKQTADIARLEKELKEANGGKVKKLQVAEKPQKSN